MTTSDDERFLAATADRLAALPAVRAVALGGSRAQGAHRPDSDWDLAVYYRGGFDPQDLRDVGWAGDVSEIGDWGGGVFNGGAWLRIDGRSVDVHYRDLDIVEHELAEASRGRFRVEPLMFHLVGIPTYLVVAELAIGRTLVGDLPRPDYPEALRRSAPPVWRGMASATLAYAERHHAPHGRVAQTAGLLAQAASHTAHAVLAGRGEWVTNDKTLLSRAGLEEVDFVVAGMTADPQDLVAGVAEVGRIIATA
ncbi:nucleotidyltransferase domain-containing protein [Nocardiopsis sp. CT-R113]|uniref:Nucleotidyltransferase domain-containing protein n=1 Tax=Nocardiopsis codii TaxID=3065942 RepID=A0ABU7K7Q5_9ACTN|nr:nucleotidyltransferase domain-containing protein [Nocardiopsis sp. CT-R113]MEE2038263.1 nucleotidyltransferase domain-containing protein [Nocardiopsis sp. CT-R113]